MPDHASSRHPSESNPSLRLEAALDLLVHGEIEMQGLLPYSSNYTFLVIVSQEDRRNSGKRKKGLLWQRELGLHSCRFL
ncbi:MAG TPA: hypothetical protein VIK33_19650 [Anaerolineae bacterium]